MASLLEGLPKETLSIIVSFVDEPSRITLSLSSNYFRRTVLDYRDASKFSVLKPRSFIIISIKLGHLDLLKWFLEVEMKDKGLDEVGDFDIPRSLTPPLNVQEVVLLSLKFNHKDIFDYIVNKYNFDRFDLVNPKEIATAFGSAGHPLWFDEKFPNGFESIFSSPSSFSYFFSGVFSYGRIEILRNYKDRIVGNEKTLELLLSSVQTIEPHVDRNHFLEIIIREFPEIPKRNPNLFTIFLLSAEDTEIVMRFAKEFPELFRFSTDALDEAAVRGQLDLLKTFFDLNAFNSSDLLHAQISSLQGKNYDCFEYLVTYHDPFSDLELLKEVIHARDASVVKYVVSKLTCPINLDEYTFSDIALTGNVEIFVLLTPYYQETDVEGIASVYAMAVTSNSTEMVSRVLSFFGDKYPQRNNYFMNNVGSIEMFHFLLSIGFQASNSCLSTIAGAGLKALEFVESLRLDYYITPDFVSTAILSCNLPLLRLLDERKMLAFGAPDFQYDMAQRGAFRFFKHCLAFGLPIPENALTVAINDQRLHVVRELVKNRGVKVRREHIEQAVAMRDKVDWKTPAKKIITLLEAHLKL